MPEHLRVHHSEYASPQQPEGMPLPFSEWENMTVSKEEELGMGVKEFLIPRPFTQVAPAVQIEGPRRVAEASRATAGKRSKKSA